jgi:hypothetical protein
MDRKDLNIGDEVYWNDPEGLTSAYFNIISFPNDEIVYLKNEFSECEAFIHELS